MNNSIEENFEVWNDKHKWPKAGDEWDGQAKVCRVPYEVWKQSLIDNLILPNVTNRTVLEIAPGHGRWSETIVKFAKRAILVDLSPNSIDRCRERFCGYSNVEYCVNDGKSLPDDLSSEIDFIWSYDSFVHMNSEVIGCYFREFARVLVPEGMAIIHHANRRHLEFAFLRNWGAFGSRLYRRLSMGVSADTGDGWRSNVSAEIVKNLAERANLSVEEQVQFWGDGRCGVPRFNDLITKLRRPRSTPTEQHFAA
jgi:ubiquinone/menaquinone biosynthesis C-methylase UbiE